MIECQTAAGANLGFTVLGESYGYPGGYQYPLSHCDYNWLGIGGVDIHAGRSRGHETGQGQVEGMKAAYKYYHFLTSHHRANSCSTSGRTSSLPIAATEKGCPSNRLSAIPFTMPASTA